MSKIETSLHSPARRSWVRWTLAGVVGVAAAAAGLSWRLRHENGSPLALPLPADPASAEFWQMRFARTDGSELEMSTLRGRPLLLNFWGTWCPPCVTEMPELDRFAQTYGSQGWQVLGLAVDNPGAVRAHLAKSPVSYLIALAGFEGSTLSRRLGNEQGGLPFTVMFNPGGNIVQRKAGATDLAELSRWVRGT